MAREDLLPGQYQEVGQQEDQIYHDMNKMSMDAQETLPYDIMLHDNSVGATRGWDGPLLFVPTEAHVVRPPDQLGFRNEKDDEYGIMVWVDNPEPGAEIFHESLQLRTDHTLCTACKDVLDYYCKYVSSDPKDTDEDAPELRPNNNVVHHSSLWSLCAFALDVECHICSQIWEEVNVLYPQLRSTNFGQYRIECCWPLIRKEDEIHKVWFVMIDSSVPKIPIRNYKHLFRMSLWPRAHFASYFDSTIARGEVSQDLSRGALDKSTEDGTNDRHETRSLARHWLNKCTQDTDGRHGLCNRRGEEYLPTRLLDVRYALEEGKARLVCPMEQPALFTSSRQYASLSHCWGPWGAKKNPVLLGTNLADRKTAGLPWSALPKTFQDAFKIASWLGLDWLWIDSLCIVQDSKADWQTEASAMDRVYMNAEVNISADSGEDSRAGCFAKREDIEVTPLEFAAAQTQLSWVVTTQNLFGWMKSATSLSRAWIHRERQLARRILHFTEKELIWECCGHGTACFASESVPGGLGSDETLFNGEAKFQNKRADVDIRTARTENTKEHAKKLQALHDLWNSTCQGLSSKSVTYATDMPIILSSLAREFHEMIPDDEYVCGLWRSTLPQSLAWWVPGDKSDGGDYIAPSWSWLCAASPVKLAARSSSHNYLPAAEILEFKSERETDDPYGRLTSAELHMSGYLRRLHFHFTKEGGLILSVIEEDENGQDRIRLIGPDWEKEEGSCFRITHDTKLFLPYQELECYAFFTTYKEWAQHLSSCTRNFEALLLEKVDQSGGADHFQRIGTIDNISDEYSLKLRYRVAPDAQIPEAGVLRAAHVENPTGYSGRPGPARLVAGETRQPEEDEQEKEEEVSNKDENQTPADLWALLTAYIRHKRWAVIEAAKDEAKREKTEKEANAKDSQDENSASSEAAASDDSTSDIGDDTDSSAAAEEDPESDGSEAEDDERDTKVLWYILQILKHPSSGFPYSSKAGSEGESRKWLAEAWMIDSETVAYGVKLEPAEVIYQFDDALEVWMETQGILPWLQRLEPTSIILG